MNDEKRQDIPDHDSDPAHTPGDGWVGEGGASYLGPATHLTAGHNDPEEVEEALGGADSDEE